ncbi:MAG: hypothetical protein WBQ55_11560 [Xanthobacteraceae bacterium]|jgi:hypothetical protein
MIEQNIIALVVAKRTHRASAFGDALFLPAARIRTPKPRKSSSNQI